jgi:hypothetical protein
MPSCSGFRPICCGSASRCRNLHTGHRTWLCRPCHRQHRRRRGKRLAHMKSGSAHLSERRFPDGSVVEIRGNPMPGGGFVATFTDVTAFRRAEQELILANETLEQRVDERTAELANASAAAERANRAKTRFLAAVSHDLAQPLNAARLFTYALGQKIEANPQREAVTQIEGALGSAETLLGSLQEISRLDAGGMRPQDACSASTMCCRTWRPSSACWRVTRTSNCIASAAAPGCAAIRNCCAASCRISFPTPCATPRRPRAPGLSTPCRPAAHRGAGHRHRN